MEVLFGNAPPDIALAAGEHSTRVTMGGKQVTGGGIPVHPLL
jgi:hypothetical protein